MLSLNNEIVKPMYITDCIMKQWWNMMMSLVLRSRYSDIHTVTVSGGFGKGPCSR